MTLTSPLSTINKEHLLRLFVFRNIVILIEIMLITITAQKFGVKLPLSPMLMIMLAYFMMNLATWFYIPANPSALYFFSQLMMDVFALTGLLYFSGGSANPFVSLFLLPLLIVAATLAKPYIWAMASFTTLCYGWLMLFHDSSLSSSTMQHMQHMDMPQSALSSHTLGMAFSFIFSEAVILFFVMSLAETIRNRDQKLAAAQEKAIRDKHMIALGTLAAGAAHELGTPLGTMAVLTKEMQLEHPDDSDLSEQLDILRSQVDRCKTTIAQMNNSVGQHKASNGQGVDISAYITDIAEQWQSKHSEVLLKLDMKQDQAPTLVVDDTFQQVVKNLLNNAAEASPKAVQMHIHWDEQTLDIGVRDFGTGLSDEVKASLGTPFFTTKPHGQGLGYYLAQAVVSRMDGSISIDNHEEGGAYVTIRIPLSDIRI